MANSTSHASLPYPIKNARFSLAVAFLDADGDPTDPTTPDTEFSVDAGAYADCAEEITTISGSNGSGYLTLTGAETNGSLIFVAAKVASGPKATLATLYPRNLPILSSGTLSAGSAGGGTLGTVLAYNIQGCFIRTTGGTGGGGTGGANNQARRIATYTTSTGAFTVTPNWETTPSTDTTYDILLPEGVTPQMIQALIPTTLGRTLDVSAGGEAGVDWANIGSPTTSQTLSGTGIASVSGAVGSVTGNVGGNVTGSVGSVATGGIAAASFAAGAIDAAAIATDAIGSAELAASAVTEIQSGLATAAALATVQADTDDIQTRLPATLVGGRMNSFVGDMTAGVISATVIADGAIDRAAFAADTGLQTARSNTAASGAADSITLDGSAPTTVDLYKDMWVFLTGGTGAGQARLITAYSAGRVASVAPNWITAPDNTSTFAILPAGYLGGVQGNVSGSVGSVTGAVGSVTGNVGGNVTGSVGSIASGGIAAASFAAGAIDATAIATDAIGSAELAASAVTEIQSGLATAAALATVQADTDDIQTKIGTPAGASLAADIAAIEAQTDDIGAAGAGLTAIPWNAAWDAEVQSEVDDALVARNLDKLVLAAGTADSGSTTTMVDAARTEGDADYWKGRLLLFTGGNIAGQCAIITDFNAGTDTFTFAPAVTQAVSTQNYVILPGISVWDDTLAEHLAAGSTGAALNAAGSAGDPWNTAVPGAYGAGTAGNILGNNLNATVSSRATPAQVNTEVDTALVDARLDELLAADSDIDGAAPPTVGSVFHELLSKTTGSFTFDQTTDSLEALRDNLQTAAAAALTAYDPPTHTELISEINDVQTDVAGVLADTNDIQARIPAALIGGRIDANVGALSGDATAADNAESFFDGTGYAGTGNTIPTVGAVTGNVGGNVVGSVGSLATQAKADVNAEVVDVLTVDTIPELPQAQPSATPTVYQALALLYTALRNENISTPTELDFKNDSGTVIFKAALTLNPGVSLTRGELMSGP